MENPRTSPGKSAPLGATIVNGGVNFSVFSRHSTGMELLLFSSAEATEPEHVITLCPEINRTYNFWHVFVEGLLPGQVYGYRACGPFNPKKGQRFDSKKLLLDPYTKAVVGWQGYSRKAAGQPGDNCAQALKSVVVDTSAYDWEGDKPPGKTYAESIIYEMHVGGFTRNPNSGIAENKRGTFSAIIEKIPYLKELGVTAVELMPIQEFDIEDAKPGLINYWGYSTLAFFALHHRYCMNADTLAGINEFRDMVKALHKAGIEVILDVVFNHTAEGNEEGPTQSFRGLDNSTYYILDRSDRSNYANFSGCGNSFNSNHPVVGRLILDCLHYWVQEMHVDGFRFDLASALSRDIFGEPLKRPPLLWTIESDPFLAGTKLIAEAWDAGGLYQVGTFVNTGQWYAEWNGPFRDDVRKFVKGDKGTVPHLANRISGSSDIYIKPDRQAGRSINFVTCHDGFTLNDLVSYNHKHNSDNGENDRDGSDSNYSWNCGTEGPTKDAQVGRLRTQQIKNMMTVLFLSQGTTMVSMGDEVRRTQKGNNNAYCHDSELSWFDWSCVEQNQDILRFFKELIAFTQSLEVFKQRLLLQTIPTTGFPYISFHGTVLNKPDWSDYSHSLAFSLHYPEMNERLHVILNAFWQPLKFELPSLGEHDRWLRIIDTSLMSPNDIVEKQAALALPGGQRFCIVNPRSSLVFLKS